MSPNQQKVCADVALNVIAVCEKKKWKRNYLSSAFIIVFIKYGF